MSKELPYFKFYPNEWITGDITICSMETQGLFINLCSFYWSKNCSICLANAKQRFSKWEANINELLEQKIIKLDSDENIIINFLDEQMKEFIKISEKRVIAGTKGGKANAKQLLKFAKAKSSNKEEIRGEEIRGEEIRGEEINIYYLKKEENLQKIQESLKAQFITVSIEDLKREAETFILEHEVSMDTTKAYYEYCSHFINKMKKKYNEKNIASNGRKFKRHGDETVADKGYANLSWDE